MNYRNHASRIGSNLSILISYDINGAVMVYENVCGTLAKAQNELDAVDMALPLDIDLQT